MTVFKTVALPAAQTTAKAKDMFSLETANKALAPIGQAITEEGKGGWVLHSYVNVPITVWRKKGIFEILLGWIPIIGKLFQSKDPDYVDINAYALIFQKEV